MLTKYGSNTSLKNTINDIYFLFIGFLTKNGSKIIAQKNLDYVLHIISHKIKLSAYKIFFFLISRLQCGVEIRKLSIRRRVYLVPFPIKLNRQKYLMVKWIMKGIYLEKSNDKLFKKVTEELIKIIMGINCASFLERDKNISLVILNKSNYNYRWY